jgi:hypothetical protein
LLLLNKDTVECHWAISIALTNFAQLGDEMYSSDVMNALVKLSNSESDKCRAGAIGALSNITLSSTHRVTMYIGGQQDSIELYFHNSSDEYKEYALGFGINLSNEKVNLIRMNQRGISTIDNGQCANGVYKSNDSWSCRRSSCQIPNKQFLICRYDIIELLSYACP